MRRNRDYFSGINGNWNIQSKISQGREWEWERSHGNGREWVHKSHARTSLTGTISVHHPSVEDSSGLSCYKHPLPTGLQATLRTYAEKSIDLLTYVLTYLLTQPGVQRSGTSWYSALKWACRPNVTCDWQQSSCVLLVALDQQKRSNLILFLPPTMEEVNAIARDVCLSVYLSVSKITQKRVHGFR